MLQAFSLADGQYPSITEVVMATARRRNPVQLKRITSSIVVLRGHKVLRDTDLAELYGVTTKRFNEQVHRNGGRFPPDFMFQVSRQEAVSLRSHFATFESGRGRHRKYLPYVFTEHGAIMAAMILNSPKAVEMSVYVVRAFVRLREALISNKELARRFAELDARLDKRLAVHDEAISAILDAIRDLMVPAVPRRRGIGFTADIGPGGTAGLGR